MNAAHIPGQTVRPAPHLVSRAGPAHKPGTVRWIDYSRRGPDKKFPVHLWPSVAEQVAEATAANRRDMAAMRHTPMKLYAMTADCGHTDPEEDEKYYEIDDLIDDWLLRNCLMETGWPKWEGSRSTLGPEAYERQQARNALRSRNYDRAVSAIPLAAEWRRAQDEYEDQHSFNVCLASPMGTACTGCVEDDGMIDEDFGIPPAGCHRREDARERRDDFWSMFTEEWLDRVQKLHADMPEADESWLNEAE